MAIRKDRQFEDIKKVCMDCGNEFHWTVGEQTFIYGLLDEGKLDKEDIDTGEVIPGEVKEPRRCHKCRARAKKF